MDAYTAEVQDFFDEMVDAAGQPRPPYARLHAWLLAQPRPALRRKREAADTVFRNLGVTFAAHGDREERELPVPFDLVPRILAAAEWRLVERGIEQRVRALNAFLADVYHDQRIVRAGRLPAAVIERSPAYLPAMAGFTPPGGVYAHVSGLDLVRTGVAQFHVLEDDLGSPSGVSTMLENREATLRLFPELFAAHRVAPVERYPEQLRAMLASVAPPACAGEPTLVLLSSGSASAAFFEHAFLADQMGIELVLGSDLFVDDGWLYMRTTQGRARVDVVYRRIGDAWLDPRAFRADSLLGVPGLFEAYRAGRVTLVNAPGAGLAADRLVYSYLPQIIEFYTGEPPLLGHVPTWRCGEPEALAHVLEHLPEMVLKPLDPGDPEGTLIGPAASHKQLAALRARLQAQPAEFVAQPLLALSTCPAFTASGLAPRHVDLRPFVLFGERLRVTPGGLTRVALKRGSLLVHAEHGGGTKDTWVLEQ